MASAQFSCRKPRFNYRIECRKKERNRDRDIHPFMVVDVTPPTKNLGIRSFPNNIHCGESITIEGQTYTVKGVTHRYQLRKGKYEPSEKRLDMPLVFIILLGVLPQLLFEKRSKPSCVQSSTPSDLNHALAQNRCHLATVVSTSNQCNIYNHSHPLTLHSHLAEPASRASTEMPENKPTLYLRTWTIPPLSFSHSLPIQFLVDFGLTHLI
ncbi:hypothetical protein FCM35_KLT18565 [Carex littledalei]|uniref:Uncharacterized protein n=1 Tax=Carex littledalei TaxID=544730 RepID=A0A833VW98_9POAL|nr:hypothetical protein FCM35_KLT18565 [Carex littledalei]